MGIHNQTFRTYGFFDVILQLCSVLVLLLNFGGGLQIWHSYLVNAVIGFMNAFQGPASSVAIGRIVPKEKLANVSGMNSFSSNLTMVLTPVLAAFLYALGGLKFVLFIDLTSFAIAFLVLLFLIFIPEYSEAGKQNDSIFAGCKEGYVFLIQNKGIFVIVLTMALLNFFSRLTYENILSQMVLARSGDNAMALGVVNAVMGIGRNTVMWSIAGLAASLPIPFINAGQNVVLYKKVPDDMQGRVFAVRNAIQFSTIPIGILLGGFLADYAFEPFMMSDRFIVSVLQLLVGKGQGSGMAVMFLCTGLMGCLFSIISYRRKEIQELRKAD